MNTPIRTLLAKLQNQGSHSGRAVTPAPMARPPVQQRQNTPLSNGIGGPQKPAPSKNAAIIYGIGCLVLYGFAFFNLATAAWFNGVVLLIPATCLAYLAYRYGTE